MPRIRFNRLELKIPPPVIVGVGGLLNWFATHWATDLFSPPWLLIAALIVVSGVFGVAGVLGCLRCKTTVHPWSPDETSVLVTQGVFRLSRNPMYLALLLLLLAYYLYQPTWFSPLVFVVVTWYLTRFQILPEERILSEKFGDQYAQYASSVRRWL
ncbi:MAG: isoprenylcysteine carboxylmethyltransferase family protein [Gammaproteobacteria bacterium]|jgi:protein-S-isoprenylcysteine O-methyltransferase Ste14|nr:isoprenylcysteine carboxylmethyltransferase family protein [Gammaproteobacteria bacterium]